MYLLIFDTTAERCDEFSSISVKPKILNPNKIQKKRANQIGSKIARRF